MFFKFYNLIILIFFIYLKIYLTYGQGSYDGSNEQSAYDQGPPEEGSAEATDPDSHEIINPKSFLTGQKSSNDSNSDSNDEINELNSNEFEPNTDPSSIPKESPYEPIADPNAEASPNEEEAPNSQKDDNSTTSDNNETNNQLSSSPYLNPPYSTEYNNENLPTHLYNNQPVYRELYPLVPIHQEKSYASLNYDYQQPYQPLTYNPLFYQQQMLYNQHLLNQQNLLGQANNFRSYFSPLQTITYEPIEDKIEKDKSKI